MSIYLPVTVAMEAYIYILIIIYLTDGMDCHVREASVEWVVYMVHRYLRLSVLRLGTEEEEEEDV